MYVNSKRPFASCSPWIFLRRAFFYLSFALFWNLLQLGSPVTNLCFKRGIIVGGLGRRESYAAATPPALHAGSARCAGSVPNKTHYTELPSMRMRRTARIQGNVGQFDEIVPVNALPLFHSLTIVGCNPNHPLRMDPSLRMCSALPSTAPSLSSPFARLNAPAAAAASITKHKTKRHFYFYSLLFCFLLFRH